MLTTEDITKLTEYQTEVFKDVFATKDDFKTLDVKIDKLQTSVDSFAASNKKFDSELLVQTHRVDPSTIRYGASKLEEWAKPVGEKLQMPLVQ